MTQQEAFEALDIMEIYRDIEADLQSVVKKLEELDNQKQLLSTRLEEIKSRDKIFMDQYKEKYGDKNFLEDLNLTLNLSMNL